MVEVKATAHKMLQATRKKRLVYAKKLSPKLDLTEVLAVMRLDAAKGILAHTLHA